MTHELGGCAGARSPQRRSQLTLHALLHPSERDPLPWRPRCLHTTFKWLAITSLYRHRRRRRCCCSYGGGFLLLLLFIDCHSSQQCGVLRLEARQHALQETRLPAQLPPRGRF
jgi:hypothetical protein